MKKRVFPWKWLACAVVAGAVAGGATESNRTIEPKKVESAGTVYTGPKSTLAVGNFENRTDYMRGLFSDGADRLGRPEIPSNDCPSKSFRRIPSRDFGAHGS